MNAESLFTTAELYALSGFDFKALEYASDRLTYQLEAKSSSVGNTFHYLATQASMFSQKNNLPIDWSRFEGLDGLPLNLERALMLWRIKNKKHPSSPYGRYGRYGRALGDPQGMKGEKARLNWKPDYNKEEHLKEDPEKKYTNMKNWYLSETGQWWITDKGNNSVPPHLRFTPQQLAEIGILIDTETGLPR